MAPTYFYHWTDKETCLERAVLAQDALLYLAEKDPRRSSLLIYGRRLRPIVWLWFEAQLKDIAKADFKALSKALQSLYERFGFMGQTVYKGEAELTREFLEALHEDIADKIPEDSDWQS